MEDKERSEAKKLEQGRGKKGRGGGNVGAEKTKKDCVKEEKLEARKLA